MINRENYPIYFIDYLDGQLDGDLLQELSCFLIENPDLKKELGLAGSISLKPESLVYPDISELLRNDEEQYGISNLDFLCISRLEGDMSESEALAFDDRLKQDPELQKHHATFSKAFLKEDESIHFDKKSVLIKHRRLIPVWMYTVAAAAALAAITWMIWPRGSESSGMLNDSSPMAQRSVEEYNKMESKTGLLVSPHLEPTLQTQLLALKMDTTVPLVISDPEMESAIWLAQNSLEPISPILPRMITGPTFYSSISMKMPQPGTTWALKEPVYYETIPEAALRLFREKILKQDAALVQKTSFSLWEVADAGLEQVNEVAGTQMHLDRTYNDVGKLERVSFNSRILDVSSPLR